MKDVKKHVLAAFKTLKNRDFVIISGAGDLFEGSLLGVSALSLVEDMKAYLLMVEPWRGEASAGAWGAQASAGASTVAADRVGAVVLAAGAGQRLGGVAKALLPIDGDTFLARVIATAAKVGVRAEDVVVVVGPPFGDEVAAAATGLGARVVVNPTPARGMASSVALGFAAIAARPVTAALLWPVDHPRGTTTTIEALLANGAGVPVHDGRGGHPALVPRVRFEELAACAELADGARAVLRGVLPRIDVVDAGVIADVDVPAELPRAEAR